MPEAASGTRVGSRFGFRVRVRSGARPRCAGVARPAAAPLRRTKSKRPPRTFFGVVSHPEPTPDRDARVMCARRDRIGPLRVLLAAGPDDPGPVPVGRARRRDDLPRPPSHSATAVPHGHAGLARLQPVHVSAHRKQRRAWRAFVKAAVRRYGPHGQFWTQHPELPNDPIRTWQVWNEPNHYLGDSRRREGHEPTPGSSASPRRRFTPSTRRRRSSWRASARASPSRVRCRTTSSSASSTGSTRNAGSMSSPTTRIRRATRQRCSRSAGPRP